ncbi:MAG: SGNH/GDSL hydrolase family protein [Magnetococcales bacterium]|nr:SGNH/GDSL hydrolase family protein [Magnetococcales bacterium]
MKKTLFYAILLFFSASISAIMGEGILRLVDYQPQILIPPYLYDNHPKSWWTLRPGFKGSIKRGDNIVDYNINSQGIRAPFDIPHKSDDRQSLFIIGDSFTFGWGVNEDDSYARILANKLKKKDLAVDVVNLGVAGFGTMQSYERLAEYAQRLGSPDAIIYMFCPNDPADNIAGKKTVVDGIRMNANWKHKWLFVRISHAYHYSRLVAFFADFYMKYHGNPRRKITDKYNNSQQNVEELPPFIATKGYVKQLINWAKERDIPLLVGTTSKSDYSKPLRRFLSKNKIQMFEVEDIFINNKLNKDAIMNPKPDGHWNQLGNSLVASKIEQIIIDNHWFATSQPAR